MAISAGDRVGPYEIGAPLGSGGMGHVYAAHDTRLNRTVAIKVLRPGTSRDPELRTRFEREARVIAALSHPHICVAPWQREGKAWLPGYRITIHID
jgi:serine/threonine protein kinase